MKKFVPHFQGAPWPDGARVLHVYALPAPDALGAGAKLANLVGACREAMTPHPITALEDGLLHCTIEMVADTTAERIGPAERAELAGALRDHLTGSAPLTVRAGSPITSRAGAFLDLGPDEGLVDLRERVRDAVRAVRGADALQHDGGRAHMSLGYAWAEGDSDPLQGALRRISPSHADFHVGSLHLLEVGFRTVPRGAGATGWEISWEPVAQIALGGGRPTP